MFSAVSERGFARVLDWVIALLIFSAPALALSVPHGGTGNYNLLIVLGMLFGWKQIRYFSRLETLVFSGLFMLFLANSLSYMNTEEASAGIGWLGKYLYLFFGLFVYAIIKPRFHFLKGKADIFLMVNSIVISAIAAYQVFYQQLPRAHGDVHPIMFGDVSVMLFGLLLFRAMFSRFKLLMFLGAALCLFAAILSETRGALIVVPLLIVIAFLYSDAMKSRVVKIGFPVLGIAIILLTMIEGSPVRDRIEFTVRDLQAYSADNSKAGALTLRFEFWRNSLILWQEKPYFGIGPGDYNIEMKRLVDSGKAVNNSEMNYRWTPHSNLVNALVTSGVVGLFLHILALYLIPAYVVFSSQASARASIYLVATLTAYFTFGLSTTWIATHAAFSMFMLFFLMSLAVLFDNHRADKKTANRVSTPSRDAYSSDI